MFVELVEVADDATVVVVLDDDVVVGAAARGLSSPLHAPTATSNRNAASARLNA